MIRFSAEPYCWLYCRLHMKPPPLAQLLRVLEEGYLIAFREPRLNDDVV